MAGIINEIIDIFTINQVEDPKDKYSLESMQRFIENKMNSVAVSSIDEYGKSPEELVDIRKRKSIHTKAQDLCGLGDIAAKQYMKSWISDLLTLEYGLNEENIKYAINFDFPVAYDKFCILLMMYFKEYRYNALKQFVVVNKLDQLKEYRGKNNDFNEELMYVITEEDIDNVFEKEVMDTAKLKYYDKLSIVVQRIYENTLGLSVIDEIRDMNLETISIGMSGIPVDFLSKISDINIKNNENKEYPMSYDSIYVNLGKEIYFSFMGFGSQKNLERVCRRIYKFKNPRQFTQADGNIIHMMADFTRVSVWRTPHSEGWGAFFRKYDVDGNLDELIFHENGELIIEFNDYLMKAKQNLVISGDQGAGKTTMLVGCIKRAYSNTTLRIWEDYFETFFRIKTPFRNILTIRKTENIDGERGLDNLKKSNGQTTIISESADDRSKSYVIKGALAASENVVWTDHSIGVDELIQTHRNACLNLGLFRDEGKAEEQALQVIVWNMALKKDDNSGERYIPRYTEFIRTDIDDYVDGTGEEAFYQNAKQYFQMKTSVKKYKAVNIFEFDEKNRKYLVKNMISENRKNSILLKLRESDRTGFLNLLNRMEASIVK